MSSVQMPEKQVSQYCLVTKKALLDLSEKLDFANWKADEMQRHKLVMDQYTKQIQILDEEIQKLDIPYRKEYDRMEFEEMKKLHEQSDAFHKESNDRRCAHNSQVYKREKDTIVQINNLSRLKFWKFWKTKRQIRKQNAQKIQEMKTEYRKVADSDRDTELDYSKKIEALSERMYATYAAQLDKQRALREKQKPMRLKLEQMLKAENIMEKQLLAAYISKQTEDRNAGIMELRMELKRRNQNQQG